MTLHIQERPNKGTIRNQMFGAKDVGSPSDTVSNILKALCSTPSATVEGKTGNQVGQGST